VTEGEQKSAQPRIGIVASDEVRIAGLIALLAPHAGAEVLLMSEPGALEADGLDVVIVDASATRHILQLLDSFRRLRPHLRLLVLSHAQDLDFIARLILHGARGVLSHTASEAELRRAVRQVREGLIFAPLEVLSWLIDRDDHAVAPAPEVHLTRRELDVLRLLISGMGNREIAAALEVRPAAVKAHLSRLMRKAGVRNRTALGIHAMEAKWT
jgi:DNA-binding NarL/FixJ family response regulator